MGQDEAVELSASTRRAYRTGQGSWRSWASGRGVPVFPARPGHLQRWLTALAEQAKRPGTLRAYHSAVSHWHRDLPGANPAHDPEVLRLLDELAD